MFISLMQLRLFVVKWSVVYYIIQLQFNYIKLTYNKLCTLLICTNVCVYMCVCVCVCDKYIVATYTCTCSGLHFVCEYVVLYIQMYMYYCSIIIVELNVGAFLTFPVTRIIPCCWLAIACRTLLCVRRAHFTARPSCQAMLKENRTAVFRTS